MSKPPGDYNLKVDPSLKEMGYGDQELAQMTLQQKIATYSKHVQQTVRQDDRWGGIKGPVQLAPAPAPAMPAPDPVKPVHVTSDKILDYEEKGYSEFIYPKGNGVFEYRYFDTTSLDGAATTATTTTSPAGAAAAAATTIPAAPTTTPAAPTTSPAGAAATATATPTTTSAAAATKSPAGLALAAGTKRVRDVTVSEMREWLATVASLETVSEMRKWIDTVASPSNSLVDELVKLGELKAQGILDDDEFKLAKQRSLS